MLALRHPQKQLTKRYTLRQLSTTVPRRDGDVDTKSSDLTEPSQSSSTYSLSARLRATSSLGGIPIFNVPQNKDARTTVNLPRGNNAFRDRNNNINPLLRPNRERKLGWGDGLVQSSLSGRLWQRRNEPESTSPGQEDTSPFSPHISANRSAPKVPKSGKAPEPQLQPVVAEAKESKSLNELVKPASKTEKTAAVRERMKTQGTDMGSLFSDIVPPSAPVRASASPVKILQRPRRTSSLAPSLSKVTVQRVLQRAGDYSSLHPAILSVRKSTRHAVGPVRYARIAIRKDLYPLQKRKVVGAIATLVKPKRAEPRP